MSLGELARAVGDACDHRAPTGHLNTARERVEAERITRLRVALPHDAADAWCPCAGCAATANCQAARHEAAGGNHSTAPWHQRVGDAWYLAARAGRGWRCAASRDGEWPQVRRFQGGGGP